MKTLNALVRRNTVLFFKDKGTFFTALITPLILLVLYTTFLGNVYKDSFLMVIEESGFSIDDKILSGCVAGQLLSSLLAVSCVTVAFCSNLISVQDKVTGARKDINITPVKPYIISLAYFISTFITTVIICLVALIGGLIYVGSAGWYMTAGSVIKLLLDIVLLSLFGTAFSSVVNHFLNSQGQISAVGSIVSSCYGFICGAYMPISSFGIGLQKVLSFMPGTYATSLLRRHAMCDAFGEMEKVLPTEMVAQIKNTVDYNVYFFDKKVGDISSYAIIAGSVLLLIFIYVIMNLKKKA